MDKVVFFHMNQLGDLLFSLPVLKAARKEFEVKIYSIVRSDLSPLLTSTGLVDVVLPKEKKFMKNIKKEKFNKAVLFSESPVSLLSAYFAGIKDRIGFDTSSLSFLLTKKVQKIGVPSLLNNRKLGIAFGLKTIQSDYTNILQIPEANLNNVKRWSRENNFNLSNVIAVSIGASKNRKGKCLVGTKWMTVINILSDKGFNCVLLGIKSEKKFLSKIVQKCKIKSKLFIAENNNILDSAALLKISSLFVGIDSGAMHLAAAVGTKCVGVFGYTDPFQIGPMPFKKHIVVKRDSVSEITPEDIISKVLKNDYLTLKNNM